jgi:hypothetical protein
MRAPVISLQLTPVRRQVRAVLITSDAATEFELERRLDANVIPSQRSSGLFSAGWAGMLQSSEEVFLAQLHRRALLCNQGFQGCILQILNRHTSNTTGDRSGWGHWGASGRIPRQYEVDSDLIFHSKSESELKVDSFQESFRSERTFSMPHGCSTSSESSWRTFDPAVVSLQCIFSDSVETVEVQQAPVKT